MVRGNLHHIQPHLYLDLFERLRYLCAQLLDLRAELRELRAQLQIFQPQLVHLAQIGTIATLAGVTGAGRVCTGEKSHKEQPRRATSLIAPTGVFGERHVSRRQGHLLNVSGTVPSCI